MGRMKAKGTAVKQPCVCACERERGGRGREKKERGLNSSEARSLIELTLKASTTPRSLVDTPIARAPATRRRVSTMCRGREARRGV